MDNYSFMLAYLLKQVLKYHKKHAKIAWGDKAARIITKEMRSISSNKIGQAGLVWSWLKKQNLDTGHVYIILIQLALKMTENAQLFFYTEDYEALIKELLSTIEDKINPDEWEHVKEFSLYYYINEVLLHD